MWFSWIVENRVAASGMIEPRDVPDLAEIGIGAILSLTERNPFPDGPPDGVAHRHVPIADFSAPSPGDLDRAVGFLREQDETGRPVLVHCGAGLGRTGTVIACFLVSEGVEPDRAIEIVRRARPGSVETPGQEACVRSFRWTEEDERG